MNNHQNLLHLSKINFGDTNQKGRSSNANTWLSCDLEKFSSKIINNEPVEWHEWSGFREKLFQILKYVDRTEKLKFWQELNNQLDNLLPFKELIVQDKDITSILTGCLKHLRENIEFSFLLPGLQEKLEYILSSSHIKPVKVDDRFQKLEENEYETTPRVVKSIFTKKDYKIPSTKIMPDNLIEWFIDNDKGDLFNPKTINKVIKIKPQRIRVKEFLKSIGKVAEANFMSETPSKTPLLNLVKVLNVDLTRYGIDDAQKIREYEESEDSEEEDVGVKLNDTKDVPGNDNSRNTTTDKMVSSFKLPSNGREAVIYLIKCYHLGQMKVFYFNYTPERVRDFYSIKRVSKSKVDGDHFIFSSMGIVQQFKDGGGVAYTLTDWYRESILYTALKGFPFIKHFLVRKCFQGWKRLTVTQRHQKSSNELTNNLLSANQVYGKSLLQISKLLCEIGGILLVPQTILSDQTDDGFTETVNACWRHCDKYLQKFHKLVKLVVDETAAELYKQLQFCQDQVHKVNLYSEDSLSIKKHKQKERQHQLNVSYYQVCQLGNFIRLVNYMTSCQLLSVLNRNVNNLLRQFKGRDTMENFINGTISIIQLHVEGSNNFGETILTITPSVENIEEMVNTITEQMTKLVLENCPPLDSVIATKYLTRYQQSLRAHSEPMKCESVLATKSEYKLEIMNGQQCEDGDEDEILLEMPFIEMPTKSKDSTRVATPYNVNPNILNTQAMVLFGRAIPSQFDPIPSMNLLDHLSNSEEYIRMMEEISSLLYETKECILDIFEENNWLLDVREEYNSWKLLDMAVDWLNVSPITIEQRVTKTNGYLKQLESSEPIIQLPNQIYQLDFQNLLTQLSNEMYFQLDGIGQFVSKAIMKESELFIKELTAVINILQSRDTSVDRFIEVFNCVHTSREKSSEYQQQIDYIKGLFDVQRAGRNPRSDKEKAKDEEVLELWNNFIFQIEEANNFVNNNRDIISLNVKEEIKAIETRFLEIEACMNLSKFVNPTDEIKEIYEELEKTHQEIDDNHKKIQFLCQNYTLLSNESYTITVPIDKINNRSVELLSLWMLFKEITQELSNWKNTLFIQFSIPTANDAIIDWKSKLEDIINDDKPEKSIGVYLMDKITVFGSFMPLFDKLSSLYFKEEHWAQLFLEIGYQPPKPYSELFVFELMLDELDLLSNSRILDVLYNSSYMESNKSREYDRIFRYWLSAEFVFEILAFDDKHGNETQQADEENVLESSRIGRSRSRAQIYYEEKELQKKQNHLKQLPITNNRHLEPSVRIITNLDKLRNEISEVMMYLQKKSVTESLINNNGCVDKEVFIEALIEVKKLIEELEECQEYWLFLQRIFEEEYYVCSHMKEAELFHDKNKKFLDNLLHIQQEPLVLLYSSVSTKIFTSSVSVNTNLTDNIQQLKSEFWLIIQNLPDIFENSCLLYPRFFFVPLPILVKLHSSFISQNIINISPFVKMCFHDITSVIFEFDFTQNEYRAQKFESNYGQSITLCHPVTSKNVVGFWFRDFELSVKSTVKNTILDCITDELATLDNEIKRENSTVLNEIDQIEETLTKIDCSKLDSARLLVQDIYDSYESWLVSKPLQALVIAAHVVYEQQLEEALKKGDKSSLHELGDKYQKKKNNLVNFIKHARESQMTSRKTVIALEKLIMTVQEQIYFLNDMIKQQTLNLSSFKYVSRIKYKLAPIETPRTSKLNRFQASIDDKDVLISYLHINLKYDYEYANYCNYCPYFDGNDRAVVSMMNSVICNEVLTIPNQLVTNSKLLQQSALLLGRHYAAYHVTTSSQAFTISPLHKFIKGSVMSGSLLNICCLDMASTNNSELITELADILWSIQHVLMNENSVTGKEQLKNRRASSPSKLLQQSESLNDKRRVKLPHINARYLSGKKPTEKYIELQNLKLNKGFSNPYFQLDNSSQFTNQSYNPIEIGQLKLSNQLFDLRYGFGLFVTLDDVGKYKELPVSLKSHLRIHSPIIPNTSQLMLSILITNNLTHLEAPIKDLTREFSEYFPNLTVKFSQVLIKSFRNIVNESQLKETLLTMLPAIFSQFSPEMLNFIKALLDKHFVEVYDGILDSKENQALKHELTLQFRVKDRSISDTEIENIIKLKHVIEQNSIIVVKKYQKEALHTIIDAVNSMGTITRTYSGSPNSSNRSRIAMDIRRPNSNTINSRGRSAQLNGHVSTSSHYKMNILKICLDNFEEDEILDHRYNGANKECKGLLTSLLRSHLTESNSTSQLWILVSTSREDLTDLVSHLSTYIQSMRVDVKFIIEHQHPKQIVDLVSIGIQNNNSYHTEEWRIILNTKTKMALNQKLLSYHGSKLIKDTCALFIEKLTNILTKPIKMLELPDLWSLVIEQTFSVLGLLLNDSKDNEQINDKLSNNFDYVQSYHQTLLSFSFINSCKSILVRCLIENDLMDINELELILRNLIGEFCELKPNLENTLSVSSVTIFGMMFNEDRNYLEPFKGARNCHLGELDTCSMGVSKYLIQLLLRYDKNIRINGSEFDINYILHDSDEYIMYDRRLHVVDSNASIYISKIRDIIDPTTNRYWFAVSNDDERLHKCDIREKRKIIVLDNFTHSKESFDRVQSFIENAVETNHPYSTQNSELKQNNIDNHLFILTHPTLTFSSSFVDINVLSPTIEEAKSIVHKSIQNWILKLIKEPRVVISSFSQAITDFIIKIFDQTEINQIGYESSLHKLTNSRWSQILNFVKTITHTIKLDMYVSFVKQLEKDYPIISEQTFNLPNSDSHNLARHKALIRIIRILVAEITRTIVISQSHQIDRLNESFLSQLIDEVFCTSTVLNINLMSIKHYPISVVNLTDLSIFPTSLLKINQPSKLYENRFCEYHNYTMYDNVSMNFITEKLTQKYPLLHVYKDNEGVIKNLTNIHRIITNNSIKNSCMLIRNYPTNLFTTDCYLDILKFHLNAKLLAPKASKLNSKDTVIQLFKEALKLSSKSNHKVILHLNLSKIDVSDVCDLITNLTQHHDSCIGLFQYLTEDDISNLIKLHYPDSFIPDTSSKAVRMSKVILQTISRNFKLVLSTNDSFNMTGLNYMEIHRENHEEIKINILRHFEHEKYINPEVVNNLIMLRDKYIDEFKDNYKEFGAPFSVNSDTLILSVKLYLYLYGNNEAAWTKQYNLYNDTLNCVDECYREIDELVIEKEKLEKEVVNLTDRIATSAGQCKSIRDKYMAANLECRRQEKLIDNLQRPFSELKEKSTNEFETVSPTYMAALETMKSLNTDDVEEVKSYPKPPSIITELVTLILIVINRKPQNWAEARETLMKIDLYEEMLYLDKDHISDEVFAELEKNLSRPEFHEDNISIVSKASASLSNWLQAVYKYSALSRDINPQLGDLLACQDKINGAQKELGKMKVRTDLMRQDLEEKIEEHKALVESKKILAKTIKDISYKLSSGKNYLSDLQPHTNQWKQTLQDLEKTSQYIPQKTLLQIEECLYKIRQPLNAGNSNKSIIPKTSQELSKPSEYRKYLDDSDNHSSNILFLEKCVQFTNLLSCPSLLFPQYGTIHCMNVYNNSDNAFLVELLQRVIGYNSNLGNLFIDEPDNSDDNSRLTRVKYIDYAKEKYDDKLNETLGAMLKEGNIVIINNMDFSKTILPILEYILHSNYELRNQEYELSGTSRLIFICNQPITKTGSGICDQLASNLVSKLLYSDWSFGNGGQMHLVSHISTYLCKLVEPQLFRKFIDLNVQCAKIQEDIEDQELQLLRYLSSKSSSSNSNQNFNPNSIPEQPRSPLDDSSAHHRLLSIDSESSSLQNTELTIRHQLNSSSIKGAVEKYLKLGRVISCDLLESFTKLWINKRNWCLHKVESIIQNVCGQLVTVAKVRDSVDPMITEEFIKKLELNLLRCLIIDLSQSMPRADFYLGLSVFCVSYLSNNQYDLEYEDEEHKVEFIKSFIKGIFTESSPQKVQDKDIEIANNELIKNIHIHQQLNKLESSLPKLSGITKSFLTYESKWIQYFSEEFLTSKKFPFKSSDIEDINLIEIVLVWMVIKPEMRDTVLDSLLLEILGENIVSPFTKLDQLQSTLIQQQSTNHIEPILIVSKLGSSHGPISPKLALNKLVKTMPSVSLVHFNMTHILGQSQQFSQEFIRLHSSNKEWLILTCSNDADKTAGIRDDVTELIRDLSMWDIDKEPLFQLIVVVEEIGDYYIIPEPIMEICHIIYFTDNWKSSLIIDSNQSTHSIYQYLCSLIHGISSSEIDALVTSYTDFDLLLEVIKQIPEFDWSNLTLLINKSVYGNKIQSIEFESFVNKLEKAFVKDDDGKLTGMDKSKTQYFIKQLRRNKLDGHKKFSTQFETETTTPDMGIEYDQRIIESVNSNLVKLHCRSVDWLKSTNQNSDIRILFFRILIDRLIEKIEKQDDLINFNKSNIVVQQESDQNKENSNKHSYFMGDYLGYENRKQIILKSICSNEIPVNYWMEFKLIKRMNLSDWINTLDNFLSKIYTLTNSDIDIDKNLYDIVTYMHENQVYDYLWSN